MSHLTVQSSVMHHHKANKLLISCRRPLTPAVCLQKHIAMYLLRSSNTSGRRKFRRDQSSAKLFCSGVPVSSSLLSVGIIFSSRTSRQLRFLILWPSSTIRYFHWKRWSRTQTWLLIHNSSHQYDKRECRAHIVFHQ